MAGTSLIALIDDIATILDDVGVLTKAAAGKTAGVLGDDLALNAQQVAGVSSERELPVVWAVAKGSAINKAILVPAALLVSAFAPWAVMPLLMLGGAFLCYEGFEKIAHTLLNSKPEHDEQHAELTRALTDAAADLEAFEREKVKGAVRTDFVLSAEIIVITLGAVAGAPFVTQVSVLICIAVIMTIGVYGLVAAIVRLDDVGLHLSRRGSQAAQALGWAILRTAPYLMKVLSIAGTAAMFLVGGGILTHSVPALHHGIEGMAQAAGRWPGVGGAMEVLAPLLVNALAGVVAGGLVLMVATGSRKALGAVRTRSLDS
jgi:predicted DNA repair protein MutK